LVEGVERSQGGPLVLGGFSQGAMVAAEVTFRSDVRVDGGHEMPAAVVVALNRFLERLQ
jgi:hypothetical protein